MLQMLRFGNYSKDSQQWRPFLLTKNYHSSPSFKTTSSSEPSFIHLPEKRSRVATKASLTRTNEASLSAVISRLERERKGLTGGGGEQWHTAEDFRRRDKITEEERRLRDTWRKIQGEDDWAGLMDPMDPVLRSELIRYGEMAQACYDAFDFDPSSTATHVELASKCIMSPFRSDVSCWFDEALRTQAVLLEAGFLNIFGQCQFNAAIWRGAGDCNCKQEAHLRRLLVHHNASLPSLLLFDKFHYIYVESRIGVEKKPKSSTTSTGDLGIGLEQLHLMSKVKKIASLQLYGEEQASVISSKQLHHRTRFITMPVRIRSQIRRLCPFRVSALSLLP
ncbi:hypothetical protein HID58_036576 [Brassica napus]|uniref:Uncharacterized protein n=1 Tax=Brassica napus TaxID=3708 RepID=A0ABQ8CA04_BRANA|nr:hypothetical protein HID58_036576 [Brassica napus]